MVFLSSSGRVIGIKSNHVPLSLVPLAPSAITAALVPEVRFFDPGLPASFSCSDLACLGFPNRDTFGPWVFPQRTTGDVDPASGFAGAGY
jgi:hypothetical protein